MRVSPGGCRLEHPADAGGAERLERVVGEDYLHLAERGAQRCGENLEGRQALLELGDLDGKLSGAGVEGRDTALELLGPFGEAGDLGGNLALEGRAGAAEPQVRPERTKGRDHRDQDPKEDQDK